MAQTDKQPAARKASSKPVRGAARAAGAATSPETESLLGLIDKLSALLARSELSELEVEAGETGIILRKPSALAPTVVPVAAAEHGAHAPAPAAPAAAAEPVVPVPTAKIVKAPLTGVFYASSSPSAPPYVTAGQPVVVGQVIGLIEAMKQFNEIKSDVSGRVIRVVAESGKLVKVKQPLIEVEP
jgi:acetyl-CoA carboxylase biotin carboxyl carrier protein